MCGLVFYKGRLSVMCGSMVILLVYFVSVGEKGVYKFYCLDVMLGCYKLII